MSTSTSAGGSRKWQGEIATPWLLHFAAAIVTGWTREFSVTLRDTLSSSPRFTPFALLPTLPLSLSHPVSFGEKLNRQPLSSRRVNYNRSDPIKRPNLFPKAVQARKIISSNKSCRNAGYRRVETRPNTEISRHDSPGVLTRNAFCFSLIERDSWVLRYC